MSHEITATDSAVFYKKAAWHGLGKVIDHAMSPREAQRLAGHDWEAVLSDKVEAFGHMANGTPCVASSRTHCLNFRSDNLYVLGQVSDQYVNFQPDDLYAMAYEAGEGVKVESALTLQGGKKLIILLRGETIDVGSEHDSVATYLALVNPYDASGVFRALPTSTRIVCNNTLQLALAGATSFMVPHRGDRLNRIGEMKEAVRRFKKTGSLFAVKTEALANAGVTNVKLGKFYADIFVKQASAADREDAKKFTEFSSKCNAYFENEVGMGMRPSLWLAANSVTAHLQTREAKRGRKASADSRVRSELFGKIGDQSSQVFKHALECV